jgi:lipopolysaccharide export system protein LptC
MNLNHPLILIFLAIGAVSSGVLLLRNTADDAETVPAPRLGIGYYMNEAELIGTGESGKILYRLRTRNASQNFEDGVVNMQGVHVIYEPEAAIPWDLRADTGNIPPSANIIQLTGNVVAATKDDNNSRMTIRTNYLELDTETYIASTPRKVTIDYFQHRVFATGMRAYFKEDRLQLISDVNGKFLP